MKSREQKVLTQMILSELIVNTSEDVLHCKGHKAPITNAADDRLEYFFSSFFTETKT